MATVVRFLLTVLSVVVGFFMMLPSVLNKSTAMPLTSSAASAVILTVAGVTQLTLGLVFAGILSIINGLVWGFIAARRRVA